MNRVRQAAQVLLRELSNMAEKEALALLRLMLARKLSILFTVGYFL